MIFTGITTEALLDLEPRIKDFLAKDQTDYSKQIENALNRIVEDLRSDNRDIKKYCTPYFIANNVEAVAPSSEYETTKPDEIERLLIVFEIPSAITTLTMKLFGRNTSDGDYTPVLFEGGAVTLDLSGLTGIISKKIENAFLYYKLEVTNDLTGFISCSLIDSSFYNAHLYLSLVNIYMGMIARVDDIYSQKGVYYQDLFDRYWARMRAGYDYNMDGEVDKDEKQNINQKGLLA